MKRKTISLILTALLAASLFAGCNRQTAPSETVSTVSAAESTAAPEAAAESAEGSLDYSSDTVSEEPEVSTVSAVTNPDSELFSDRDFNTSYSSYVTVTLSDSGSTTSGAGVSIDGSTITVNQAGAYLFTGSLSQGQIIVNVAEDEKVQIILDNAGVTNAGGPALYILSGDKVFVTTAVGSANNLSSTGALSDDSIDGAIYATCDLTLNGQGSLEISSEAGHGVVCKDDLKITSGAYEITTAKDGFHINDSIRIAGGSITVSAGSDGMDCDHTDADKGYIAVLGGEIEITAGGAGLKSSSAITVSGGSIILNTTGDGLHSDGDVSVTDGALSILTEDDGVHADNALSISGGTVTVQAHEGLEAYTVDISGGVIDLVTDDDGINAAGSNGADLTISGGTITIDSEGDSLDANGNLLVSGGDITITGPSRQDNGIIDYDYSGSITGGTLIATGISGMQENFDSSSAQGSILYTLNSTYSAGTELSLTDENGNLIASMTAQDSFQVVLVSAPEISSGQTYTLTVGADSFEIEMTSLQYGEGFGFGMGGGMMGGFGGPNQSGGQMSGQPGGFGGRR